MKYCILCILFLGCSHPYLRRQDIGVHEEHLEKIKASEEVTKVSSEFFMVLLVDAKHLNYTTAHDILITIAKHPNGSKRRDVGHAWILIAGNHNGKKIYLELGHSGEIQQDELSYLDGVRDLSEKEDKNPIRHLYKTRKDGFLQLGSGGHVPTFAVSIPLEEKIFSEILYYIDPAHYAYQRYSFLEEQCCTFVAKVAKLAGVSLEIHQEICLEPITKNGIRLWSDAEYQIMKVPTPDVLEKSLIELVHEERARCALKWYKKVYVPFIKK